VIQQYVANGQAKFELRILPTAGGQTTHYVAQLQECINHQQVGLFWQTYDVLYGYAENGQYFGDVAQQLSDTYHLDYDKLIRCAGVAKQVDADTNFAIYSGVTGTPAVMMRVGDGAPQFITLEGRTYNAGGPPLVPLAQAIEAANAPASSG
jgi:protein-disulfide isomerase